MKDSKIVEITGLTEADIKGLMAGMPADWTDAEKVDAACVLAWHRYRGDREPAAEYDPAYVREARIDTPCPYTTYARDYVPDRMSGYDFFRAVRWAWIGGAGEEWIDRVTDGRGFDTSKFVCPHVFRGEVIA